jgi:hypothetical protein
MRLIVILFLAVLSACSSALPMAPLDPQHIDPSVQFDGPNGGAAHLMQCFDGVGCYKRARDVCPGGHTIFDSIDRSSGGSSGFSVSTAHYIAFECKKG